MANRSSVQVTIPDGSKLLPQDYPALRQAILKPQAQFWQTGSAELSLEFQGEVRASRLLVLWERTHGYHLLHWVQTLDDPLVALSGYSYLDLVEFEICGELVPTPAAMFVTPTVAWRAITKFLETGVPDPALVWVRKREQRWGGTQRRERFSDPTARTSLA